MKDPKTAYLVGALFIFTASAAARAQPPATSGRSLPGAYNQAGLGAAANALRSPGYVGLSAGASYTSNAALTESQEITDGIAFAGVDADYLYQGRELSLDALGNVERIEYFKGTFPGTFYGQFNGSATWGRPTELLQWRVADSFGEGMVNPLASPTPRNQQWVNHATTGPYLNFNIDSADRLTLFGLYARTTFERSPFDSQSYDGGATFRHALSAVSSVSLNATEIRTDFLHSEVAESFPGAAHGYDTRSASLGYERASARAQITVVVGYNTVNYGGRTQGSPLAELQLGRQVSAFSRIYVSAETGYSTFGSSLGSPSSAALMAADQPALATGAGAFAETATASPSKRTAGSAGWAFHRVRTSFSVVGLVSRQQYVRESEFDQTNATFSATLERELGRSVSAQVHGSETFGNYGNIHARNRSTEVNLSLSRQFRSLSFSAYGAWLHRRSFGSIAGLPVASYDDERVGLRFTYDLIGQGFGQRGQGFPGSY